MFVQCATSVRSDKSFLALGLGRSSRVCPIEWLGHRLVVVGHEFSELRFEIGHGCEISTAYQFSVDDTEDHLDLIEPRTMLGEVDKADAMV